jgi:hypothetical protein
MDLQDRLDSQKKQLESSAPKEAVAIMHHATEQLKQSGIMDRVKTTGDVAPDFTLTSIQGQEINLSKKVSEGPVVLGFFRGGW